MKNVVLKCSVNIYNIIFVNIEFFGFLSSGEVILTVLEIK